MCPHCGAALPYGANFCERCGQFPNTHAPAPTPAYVSTKVALAIVGGVVALVLVAILSAAYSQRGRRAAPTAVASTPEPAVDRLAPLTPQQKKDVESVMRDTDELDNIYKSADTPSRKADRFNAQFKKAFTNFQRVNDSLPKNDARMMLYNMMDGYGQAGLLVVGKGRGVTNEDAAPSMLAAGMRKVLLKHILTGKLSDDEKKLLIMLRQQDK